jgi:asparagine synthase (glutamine-hydrolysing)
MCGIFALLNNNDHIPLNKIISEFEKGRGRGPENSHFASAGIKTLFGFHRLAINGLNAESNQPIVHNNISLICNGEIYNYKELYESMDIAPTTDSDCEVIIHLYQKYGIEHTLQMLDGVFAFILLDNRLSSCPAKLYAARDPYGVRPLFWLQDKDHAGMFGFASELKMLSELKNTINNDERRVITNSFYELNSAHVKVNNNYNIEAFPPGQYAEFSMPWKSITCWSLSKMASYHSTGFNSNIPMNLMKTTGLSQALDGIQTHLMAAVFKRCCTTDRPMACLLSGGLDSSLITALVVEYHRVHNLPRIETYSIGLQGSEDLKYARLVADYLGTKHAEVLVTEQDFIDAVPHVIKAIESYDTTTVRASLGNWLLGKYIAQHSEAKVIFNGDGSDELCGGYLYMHACPDEIEFDRESRRLLKDIHYFDVLRSDRCISSHGLEPRTPFLDRSLVQYYLSIHPTLRFHPKTGQKEKYLLRSAFSEGVFVNSKGFPLLPKEVIWRRKEAFSDGVSHNTRSLYEILQEHSLNIASTEISHVQFSHNNPITMEQKWYRSIFTDNFGDLGHIIPYFWMPKYVQATDASARTLNLYSKDSDNAIEI